MRTFVAVLTLYVFSSCQATRTTANGEQRFLDSYRRLFEAENAFTSAVPRWREGDEHGAKIAYLATWQRLVPLRDSCSAALGQWLYERGETTDRKAAVKQALIQAMQNFGVTESMLDMAPDVFNRQKLRKLSDQMGVKQSKFYRWRNGYRIE